MSVIFILALIIFFVWLLNRGGERVNEYFYKAIQVWLLHDDENARIAALAAVKVASPHAQRNYVGKLRVIQFELSAENSKLSKERAKLLMGFINEIKMKIWTLDDAAKEREKLFEANPEYATALNKYDPTVFSKRYREMDKNMGRHPKLKLHEKLLVSLRSSNT